MTRYMPEWWALPALDDENREFFTSGRIVVQSCTSCGAVQHPPEDVCHRCQGSELAWRTCKGEGTIYSHIVVEHPIPAMLRDRVPYAVILVSLDDLPEIRILGNPVNVAPERVAIGQRVRAVFEEVEDAETKQTLRIPQWEIVG